MAVKFDLTTTVRAINAACPKSVYLYVLDGNRCQIRNKRGATLTTFDATPEQVERLAKALAAPGRRIVLKGGHAGSASINHVWSKDGNYTDAAQERAERQAAKDAEKAQEDKSDKSKDAKADKDAKAPGKAKTSPAPEGLSRAEKKALRKASKAQEGTKDGTPKLTRKSKKDAENGQDAQPIAEALPIAENVTSPTPTMLTSAPDAIPDNEPSGDNTTQS